MHSKQSYFTRTGETRRQFIKKSGLAAAAVAGAGLLPFRISAAETKSSVAIVVEGPTRWPTNRRRNGPCCSCVPR